MRERIGIFTKLRCIAQGGGLNGVVEKCELSIVASWGEAFRARRMTVRQVGRVLF